MNNLTTLAVRQTGYTRMRYFRERLFTAPLALAILICVGFGFASTSLPVARAQEEICSGPFLPVSPALTDLGNDFYVRMDGQTTTFRGGLYPDGSNQPPAEHAAAGLAAAARIQPLDTNGAPDPQAGKIVMISIGMSNTSSEFGRFIELSNRDPDKNPDLVLINGALGGQTAEDWVDPQALAWQELDARLAHFHVSPEQVQAAWIKQTLTRGGEFPAKAQELQAALEAIVHNLKARFPNLQIAFFSSRTRSYTYWRGLSPEPIAFETGFAVKWMIEKQINGDLELNFDPNRGEVRAPFLAWGPYLWADGMNPRSDGLIWTVEDLTRDCTHPTDSGKTKVANMLTTFFKSDPLAQGWFLASPFFPPTPGTISPTFQPSPTNTRPATQTRIPSPSATPRITQPFSTAILSTSQITPDLITTPKPKNTEVRIARIKTDSEINSRANKPSNGWVIGLAAGFLIIGGWIANLIYSSFKKQ